MRYKLQAPVNAINCTIVSFSSLNKVKWGKGSDYLANIIVFIHDGPCW